MSPDSRTFTQYLGLHSLLIGIFPFYIPVYLWNQKFGLGHISVFISLAGIGFCCGLWVWDRIRLKINLGQLIALSLILEIILLFNVHLLEMNRPTLLVLGVTYGIYNSFYWTTLRALFFDLIDVESSGRKYGNLQILVGFSLQVGILIGGFLLETTSLIYMLIVSAVVAVIGYFVVTWNRPGYPIILSQHDSLSLKDVVRFKDNENSRLIFLLDGFFLFAESFYWVITLFLLVHESFSRLGIMVLSLAIIFGIIFYLLKNTIDRLGRNRIYRFAVILYALSWAFRALTDDTLSLEVLYLFLVVITFCTAFFRLAMNKRFYDLAKLTCSHDYLVLKSYYSQAAIVVIFGLMGYWLYSIEPGAWSLTPIYWISTVFALIYLIYGIRRYSQ